MRLYICMFLIFVLQIACIAQNIVINELLYDPDGSDGGKEWIEIYNSGDETVNLWGWKIQSGGSELDNTYLFMEANTIIQPGDFLLIGESSVQNADITTDLDFQNGNDSTDGVRIVSADDLYTDTILYDEPNTNNLPDDVSTPGIPFVPSVTSSNSLARKHNGVDTDDPLFDWFECEVPTPGDANFYPIDLELSSVELNENEGLVSVYATISNLSTEYVDKLETILEISVNDTLLETYELPEILPENSIEFYRDLGDFADGIYQFDIAITYLYDNNLTNNSARISLLIGDSPLVLNEVLFKPSSGNAEWLEIFNRSACGYYVDNFKIIDGSGGEIVFSDSIADQDFLVVCQDISYFLQQYPDVNEDKVIQADTWTSLNNTSESLILTDGNTAKFDSLSYEGGDCPYDFSIERVNPFNDQNIQWQTCVDSSGATPTFPNSVLPLEYDLRIISAETEVQADQIIHSVLIEDVGLESCGSATINCYISTNSETSEDLIFQTEIDILDTALESFSSGIPLTGYTTFHYEITSALDLNDANDHAYTFHISAALPFVINEIMYDPLTDEPEWIELKINDFIPNLEYFFLFVDQDSILIENSDNEYILATDSYEDKIFLEENNALADIPVFLGLGSLSNTGKTLSLVDQSGNIIEEFSYDPAWNDDQKGVSIERVNPLITAVPENWGPAIDNSTPGNSNSIYVQNIPQNVELTIAPNPFSPYKSERTIISYNLPEILSTVTMRIFDLKGRLMKKILNQSLQSAEGELIWDGKDDESRILPIGLYILAMEATSRETEKVYFQTGTVVIAK